MAQVAPEATKRQRVASWIKRNRRDMGLSPAELALNHLGMRDPSLVVKWEAGKSMPGGLYMLQLIELFRSTPEGDTLRNALPPSRGMMLSPAA